jgi:hypothetical protein
MVSAPRVNETRVVHTTHRCCEVRGFETAGSGEQRLYGELGANVLKDWSSLPSQRLPSCGGARR